MSAPLRFLARVLRVWHEQFIWAFGLCCHLFPGGRFMRFDDVKVAVEQILRAAEERFLSAYQICQRLEVADPKLWTRLVAEYPSVQEDTPMGEGTGRQYSPATFVANALNYFFERGELTGLKKELFDCEGVSFGATAPGYTGNVVGIWAIKG